MPSPMGMRNARFDVPLLALFSNRKRREAKKAKEAEKQRIGTRILYLYWTSLTRPTPVALILTLDSN